jgi:hypothetical protein
MKLRMMTNRGIKNQTKKYHKEIADLYLSLSLSLSQAHSAKHLLLLKEEF